MRKSEYISKLKNSKKAEQLSKLPEFVKFENGTVMRLRCSSKDYYRDAGMWFIKYSWKNGKLLTRCTYDEVSHLKNKELIEISEEEWYNNNEGYIPKKYLKNE